MVKERGVVANKSARILKPSTANFGAACSTISRRIMKNPLIGSFTSALITRRDRKRPKSLTTERLSERPEIIAITKTEGLDSEIIDMQIDELKKAVHSKDAQIFVISSQAHKGLTEVLRALKKEVTAYRSKQTEEAKEELLDNDVPVISLSSHEKANTWQVEKQPPNEMGVIIYKVTGPKIEKFGRRTDFNNFEGVNRLRDIMRRFGIEHELIRQGASGDSIIRIAGNKFTLVEQ